MGGLVDEDEVEESRDQGKQPVDRVQIGHPEREVAMDGLEVERSEALGLDPGRLCSDGLADRLDDRTLLAEGVS